MCHWSDPQHRYVDHTDDFNRCYDCGDKIFGKYGAICDYCRYALCVPCHTRRNDNKIKEEKKEYKPVVNCHKDIEKYGSVKVVYSVKYFEEKDNN